jgi:hypothetical protein
MSIEIGWASVSIMISLLGHALFTVWTAASFKTTIASKIDSLVLSLQRIDKELEKRDIQIAAAWKKIDSINERMIRIEVGQNENK